MKGILQTLIVTLFLLVITSCDKNDSEANPSENIIIGKWELREIYDSHQNHYFVPDSSRNLMEFLPNENFSEIEYRGNLLPNTCQGTYLFISNEELLINSSCQTDTITQAISLSGTTLIFGFQGREEYIYKKYFKID